MKIIDIHSHILPGIDDGAKSMQETKEMLDIAVAEGIDAIVTTPHYEVGMTQEICQKYQRVFEEVCKYIESNQLPLKLYIRTAQKKTFHKNAFVITVSCLITRSYL